MKSLSGPFFSPCSHHDRLLNSPHLAGGRHSWYHELQSFSVHFDSSSSPNSLALIGRKNQSYGVASWTLLQHQHSCSANRLLGHLLSPLESVYGSIKLKYLKAGASLESLAKGAVQFSRKFAVWELQDRWYSLLYDPVVSDESSSRMIEFERSISTITLKFSKAGNSKENKILSGKRKSDGVRTCYYALRKRICNEPFNSFDLGFLIAPGDNSYFGNKGESGNSMLGEAISDRLGFQETNLDIMQELGLGNVKLVVIISYFLRGFNM